MKRKAPSDKDGHDDATADVPTPLKHPRLEAGGRPSPGGHPRPGCILFQNAARSVLVLDIPRSLEEAQVPPDQPLPPRGRIYSSPPVAAPFATPEPKDAAERQMALPPSALLRDLMTGATVRAALAELAEEYAGPLCLPRLAEPWPPSPHAADSAGPAAPETGEKPSDAEQPRREQQHHRIPPRCHVLNGTISALARHVRRTVAPCSLDLVVLDPPWPNASARRKTRSYAVCSTMPETARLLASVPVASLLAPGGLVAVWVTNKHAILPLLTGGKGVFAGWGVELVAEWVWVKVTTGGEPVFDLDGHYRKPWERVLIARRVSGGGGGGAKEARSKVIVAVPDVHSRKPNLRAVVAELLPDGYRAMEVFARNLTAGWWSWGDEVLKFQAEHWWTGGAEEAEDQQSGVEPGPKPAARGGLAACSLEIPIR